MRVAVIGTGALGCLFAARLASCAEVWMLGTWAEGVAAAAGAGVRVHEMDGTMRCVPIRAVADPVQAPPADVALLLVKSYQTDRAAAWAAQVLAPDGLAVTLQNGLDNGPRVARAVGATRTVVGVTFEAATLLGPAEVRHAGRGPTLLGPGAGAVPVSQASGLRGDVPQASGLHGHVPQASGLRGDVPQASGLRSAEHKPEACVTSPRSQAEGSYYGLVALLRQAGFAVEVALDIEGILWGKAVVNAAINPLTALWRVPNGELLATADRRALLADLAREAAAVAAARGITLPYPDPVARVEEVCRATAANRSSMLQDIERGRPTEIDSINGVIVAEGRRLAVPTPLNETIWRLVRGMTEC